jgi:DNA-binding MarR family transcriptional regulator
METTARHAELATRLRDLVRVVRQLRQRRTDVPGGPGVPPGLLGTLLSIDGVPGCHAKELAAGAGLDQSTVSRAVAALVAHGLIERRPDPADKRASILAVTAAGHAAIAEAQDWYDSVLRDALAGWREADVVALTALLRRFTADLDHVIHSEGAR